jgi:hypothetical protein
MAEPKKDMSKDAAVIEAVGYGFDASVRKGTAAGQKAMEGFMSKLSDEQKMFARAAFNEKIAKQSKILDNPDRIAKGEKQVKVYREAGEAGRKINYQKEFATAPKKVAKPAATSKPTATPKAEPEKKKSTFSRVKISKPSPAISKPAASTPVKSTAPSAPIRKAMGMPSAKQTTVPKAIGSGPSQMLSARAFEFKKKK